MDTNQVNRTTAPITEIELNENEPMLRPSPTKMAITRQSSHTHSNYNSRNNTTKEPESLYEDDDGLNCCTFLVMLLCYILVLATFPLSMFFCVKIAQEYERVVIFRLGRVLSGKAKGPGMLFLLPCIDQYAKVDLRVISIDIPPQEALTRDSVTVSVDAAVYFKINDAKTSIVKIKNPTGSTRLLAQTTLRNMMGARSLSEVLTERDEMSKQIQAILDEATYPWGVKVERVEIKDVRLPQQLQRAMAAEAEASREAKAKVIAAQGEMDAAQALRNAAKVISESQEALQLRYLQTLTTISAEKNSTIIFPLPINSPFAKMA